MLRYTAEAGYGQYRSLALSEEARLWNTIDEVKLVPQLVHYFTIKVTKSVISTV